MKGLGFSHWTKLQRRLFGVCFDKALSQQLIWIHFGKFGKGFPFYILFRFSPSTAIATFMLFFLVVFSLLFLCDFSLEVQSSQVAGPEAGPT